MDKKIKTGIIGTGRIGMMHAENIKRFIPETEIKTVADIYADKARDWGKSLDIENITIDYKDIINDPEIEVVVICSSTDTHARFIIEASKAGKHIFCEKPIDLNINKIKEAIKAIDEAGIKFQLGFNRRFDHNFSKVHDLIRENKIGDVYIIKITSWDPEPPPIEYLKVCGGIFLDMTIHDFDMARFLSGSEVTEVSVNAAALVEPDIGRVIKDYYDTAIVNLKFENGIIGVIDNCRKAIYGYDQRVEILGSKGSIIISNDIPTTAVVSTEKGVLHEKPLYFFIERYSDSYIEEMKQFYKAIINDEDTHVGAIDGLKSVEIGLTAQESAIEGKTIKVDEFLSEASRRR